MDTPGGRGGAVYRVTNLNDSGPGSLRAALESTGPRFVIFETSGTISLTGPIFVTNPYLTIAGQTAPSPGITIRNWPIYIDTHDVVVQHIRMRTGDTVQNQPGGYVSIGVGRRGAHHVVFDHISVAWTMYMGFFIYNYAWDGPQPKDVAILDSVFAFGLVKSAINASYAGMGGGLGAPAGDGGGLTMARSLFVHNSHRQPQFGVGQRINVVNNVAYGSGPSSVAEDYSFLMVWQNSGRVWDYNPAYSTEAAVVNTVTIPSIGTGSGRTAGSDSGNRTFYFNFNKANIDNQKSKIWLFGNKGPYITGPSGAGQRSGIVWGRSMGGQNFANADLWYKSEPDWHANMQFHTIPTESVTDYVFANAGARPLDRDAVDKAAVAQARAGERGDLRNMGSRIYSQNDMGGWPVLAQNTRRLTVPANPHAIAPGQTFRTNIEMWLEAYARALEPAQSPTQLSAPSNLRHVE